MQTEGDNMKLEAIRNMVVEELCGECPITGYPVNAMGDLAFGCRGLIHTFPKQAAIRLGAAGVSGKIRDAINEKAA